MAANFFVVTLSLSHYLVKRKCVCPSTQRRPKRPLHHMRADIASVTHKTKSHNVVTGSEIEQQLSIYAKVCWSIQRSKWVNTIVQICQDKRAESDPIELTSKEMKCGLLKVNFTKPFMVRPSNSNLVVFISWGNMRLYSHCMHFATGIDS